MYCTGDCGSSDDDVDLSTGAVVAISIVSGHIYYHIVQVAKAFSWYTFIYFVTFIYLS